MTDQEYERERDRMLKELAALIPQWGAVRTVLVRGLAARLQRVAGVPLGVASGEINHAIANGIRLGYALREYDIRHPPKQSTIMEAEAACVYLMTTQEVQAA